MTIWKFTLQIQHLQEIEMPAGARILHVGLQGNSVCLWAMVNPGARKVMRQIRLRGTGATCEFDETADSHIGTVQQPPFVWHLFDMGEQ